MREPPEKIDGAIVLAWAWSSNQPFFIMPFCSNEKVREIAEKYKDKAATREELNGILAGSGGIPIHGLAICQYYEKGAIYRLSCDSVWESQDDSPYDSVKGAMSAPSAQYDVAEVQWVHRMSEAEALRRLSEEEAPALPADYASDDTIRQLVGEDRMIEVIGRLRAARGLSLWDAKLIYDRFKEELGK